MRNLVIILVASLLQAGALLAQVEPLGDPFQVTADTQPLGCPKLAMLHDGSFMILVQNEQDDLFAYPYAADGAPKTPVLVASLTGFFQWCAVGGGLDGFLVACSEGEFGDSQLWARALRADGTPNGDLFMVDNGYWRYLPTVTGLPDGGFLVLWLSRDEWLGNQQVFGRRVIGAAPSGDRFQVSDAPKRVNHELTADMGAGGGVVLWPGDGRRLTRNGTPTGNSFRVADSESRRYPHVEVDTHQYVVTWEDSPLPGPTPIPPDNEYQIFARRFSLDGTPLGPDIAIVSGAEEVTVYGPDIALGPYGDALVIYRGADQAPGVITSSIEVDLLPRNGNTIFSVMKETSTETIFGCLAADAGGDLAVISWSESDWPDSYQVHARRFRFLAPPAPIPTLARYSQVLLGLLLLGAGVVTLRRL